MENLNNQKTIARIRNGYTARPIDKTAELKALDKKVRLPAKIGAYVGGSLSTLVLGTGMCLCLDAIGADLHPAFGIVIGVVGIALCVANYFVYKVVSSRRKKKYADRILALCDEAANA